MNISGVPANATHLQMESVIAFGLDFNNTKLLAQPKYCYITIYPYGSKNLFYINIFPNNLTHLLYKFPFAKQVAIT